MRGGTRRVRDASTSDAQNTIPNDSIAMHTIGKSIGVCCLFCLVYVLGCLKATGVYNRYNLFIFFFFPGLVVVHVFQPHLFICFTFNSCTYAYLPNTLCYIDTVITTKNHAWPPSVPETYTSYIECLFQHISTTPIGTKSTRIIPLCVCIYPQCILRCRHLYKSNRRP